MCAISQLVSAGNNQEDKTTSKEQTKVLSPIFQQKLFHLFYKRDFRALHWLRSQFSLFFALGDLWEKQRDPENKAEKE